MPAAKVISVAKLLDVEADIALANVRKLVDVVADIALVIVRSCLTLD